ncbi:MAG: peptide ABC transporter substrate-binding protein [Bdellovibrionales bacterium]|nr:peptide ABC transporter substrate-binding protein [Bdellovibrionales bacterium]
MKIFEHLDSPVLFLAKVVLVAITLGAVGCSSPHLPENTLVLAMSSEPPDLNATKATDSESFFILGHVMEGLTRSGKDGKPAPGVAERWEITDKGAVFYLRKNARWSDGKPVTAHDFVYSWQTVVDPKNASEYAFILFPVKNAERIVGKKAAPQELGVQALDDFTLKVTFEKPCGYFLSLTSFASYFPLRKDFHQAHGERYGAEYDTMLYNGPFALTKWIHGAAIRMEKNPHYWNAEIVKLNAIDIPYITADDGARFNLFRNGKIDLVHLSKNTLETAMRARFRMRKFADGTLYFLEYNFKAGRPTVNKNLRLAIQAVFDADEYVDKVVSIPGTIPGSTLIPAWITGKKKLFREDFPIIPKKPDLDAAKKYLASALRELGLKDPPSLVWLTGDSPRASKEAEYFQSLLKSTLGIELKIDKQIFKQRLAKMSAGEFDIVSAGWGPDYNDPMTFADLFTSWNENNRGLWRNTQYDEWIRKAQSTTDPATRMDAMAAAERLLLDEQPILPLYESSVIYTQSDELFGVRRNSVGFDPDYTEATVQRQNSGASR